MQPCGLKEVKMARITVNRAVSYRLLKKETVPRHSLLFLNRYVKFQIT